MQGFHFVTTFMNAHKNEIYNENATTELKSVWSGIDHSSIPIIGAITSKRAKCADNEVDSSYLDPGTW